MNRETGITAASGVTGTALMTLFSYILSIKEKENFSEPEHLSTLLHRLMPQLSKKDCRVAGWNLHFVIGVMFAVVYAALWRRKKIAPSFTNSLLLGAASGLIAVISWKSFFKLHPLPPFINYRKYYLQLVPAHLVFAAVATLTYRYLHRKKCAGRPLPQGYSMQHRTLRIK